MISDKIQSISVEYRTFKKSNTEIRWSKGIKNSKSKESEIDRDKVIVFLKSVCKREGVSFQAMKNILMI